MSSVSSSDVSAAVRSSFDFTVDKFPLFGPDNMSTDQYGLFRSDTGYLTGVKSISKQYVPHTTDDVCALVEAASTAFDGSLDLKCHWRNGHYVSITPTLEQRRSVYGTADAIWPRIMLRGGFDGKGFKATMGYWRDLCLNMSMLETVESTSVSIRHSSNLRMKMDELIQTFEGLKTGWDNLTEVAANMQSRTVNRLDYVREVFADRMPSQDQLNLLALNPNAKIRAIKTWENMLKAMQDRLDSESIRSNRAVGRQEISAWEAFNMVQGYVQHDAQAKTGFKDQFSRILRAANDRHVKRAAQLAMSA
tara:strand:+ start:8461 stop:9378 length:918 start_codon:yes stop_codon:yes gene_type:complete